MERLARTDVYGGEVEAIGVRVFLDGQQLADDDGAPVGAPLLDALDFHAQQRQALCELLRGLLDIDVLAEPVERHSHRN